MSLLQFHIVQIYRQSLSLSPNFFQIWQELLLKLRYHHCHCLQFNNCHCKCFKLYEYLVCLCNTLPLSQFDCYYISFKFDKAVHSIVKYHHCHCHNFDKSFFNSLKLCKFQIWQERMLPTVTVTILTAVTVITLNSEHPSMIG